MTSIDQSILREILSYEPASGVMRWKVSRGRVREGAPAGALRKDGYILIGINGEGHLRHRLAWLWMTGELPTGEIDHINGIRGDDRWDNLRDVSRSWNQQNQTRAQASNSTGLLGVSFHAGKYRSRISVDGKETLIGRYDSPQEAYAAYVSAKRRLHAGGQL